MRKKYSSPEIDVVKYSLKDVLVSSPTETTIPEQGATTPGDSSELPELPDL